MVILKKQYTIETEKPKEQIIELLKAEVIEGSVSMMVKEHRALPIRKNEFFIGKVENDSFIVTRMYKTGRSPWSPVLRGTITCNSKSIINLVYKAHLSLNLFFSFIYSTIIFKLLITIYQNGDDKYIVLSTLIAVILIFYVPSLINFKFQVKRMNKFLDRLFNKSVSENKVMIQ